MNYANCKSYNADFDGDEMNMHALQTYMAKAEAELCMSDQLYENPTNGKPLREIMQDATIAAVYLSMKDLFFDKSDYSELLYQATCSLLVDKPKNTRLFLLKPAIMKPRVLWTGKQLISNVVKVIVEFSDLKFKHGRGLTMRSATKISKNYMKGFEEEAEVVFVDN
jgi:DNA-directed RNA polymerase I subunit RPA1